MTIEVGTRMEDQLVGSPITGYQPIYELRTYKMVPALLPHYLRIIDERLRVIRGDNFGRLAGFWFSGVGGECAVHHLWEFTSLDERQHFRKLLALSSEWRAFLADVAPAIQTQRITFMRPITLLTIPEQSGCIYELIRYRAAVGKVQSVADEVLRRTFTTPTTLVGAWIAEAPDPNEVIQLLGVHDLNEHLSDCKNREQTAWWMKVRGEITECRSALLSPVSVSPLR